MPQSKATKHILAGPNAVALVLKPGFLEHYMMLVLPSHDGTGFALLHTEVPLEGSC